MTRKSPLIRSAAMLPITAFLLSAAECDTTTPAAQPSLDWNMRIIGPEGTRNEQLGDKAIFVLRPQPHQYYLTLRAKESHDIIRLMVTSWGKAQCGVVDPRGFTKVVTPGEDRKITLPSQKVEPSAGTKSSFLMHPRMDGYGYARGIACGYLRYEVPGHGNMQPAYARNGSLNVQGEVVTTKSAPYYSQRISLTLSVRTPEGPVDVS